VLHGVSKLKLIKFFRASSRVKWLKVDKTDVSRTMVRENFINLSRRESLKSYSKLKVFLSFMETVMEIKKNINLRIKRGRKVKGFSYPLMLRATQQIEGPHEASPRQSLWFRFATKIFYGRVLLISPSWKCYIVTNIDTRLQ
jgi:hypothetical protein